MSVSNREAFNAFGKIGLMSFGGPAAQISLMHKVLVDQKKWLTEQQFLNALSFCMLLPGPEAMQLATYAGWRLNGIWGGLISGLLFVLPGALVIFAFAALYAFFGELPLMQQLFLGVKAAVVIIVLEALLKVAKRALKAPVHLIIAGLAFIGIFAFGTKWAAPPEPHQPVKTTSTQTLKTIAIGLAVWIVPIALLATIAPAIMSDIAIFFSKLAVVMPCSHIWPKTW